ncbi:LOB domain-containing protein 24-like [Neltuma alba]|uniref:LOB domain-containing protein 24-like n=1 Tax=Neltuma alba TaxID=207710 RepID=UPI0010A31131|nr:LOB domain-containing protein 24-like [Prosopis alba]
MISGRCAACKNQRRKCPSDCIFSPYFPPNDPERFACVHRIYGSSNVGKMLQQIPVHMRAQAVDTLYFEARCRIEDPVYGCVKLISQLHQNLHDTESELARVQALIAFHKLQITQVELHQPTLDASQSSIEQFQNPWFIN